MSRAWLIVPLLVLYLLHLGGVGMLGPDEPRYASIGRAMAASGDWITPRLDGKPWFEKPPLNFWLTGAANRAGLRDEWAARLPQALLSLAFLVFFYSTLAREFRPRVALAATAILATSAGWLAYSFAALTDLPMSAALGAAVLVTIFESRPKYGWLAGALVGLAMLSKGFVPLVLFAPLLLIARGKRLTTLAGAVIVAAPWYLLCWIRNGSAFWNDFFWKQHVARFLTPGLEHVQPWWYYSPILLAGFFPWTPLFALLARRKTYEDAVVRLLGVWVVFGLVFFSVSKNKLPGYLLPLMPAVAILLGAAWENIKQKQWWLAACGALLIALPAIATLLPDALLLGLSRATAIVHAPELAVAAAGALVAGGAWWLAWRQRPEWALLAVAFGAGLGIIYIKQKTFPLLDATVSVRQFWDANRAAAPNACLDQVSRTWQYGLNYFAGRELAECVSPDARPRITVRDRRLVLVN